MNAASDAAAPVRAPMRSPCVRVCAVDPKTNWCQGCYRTLKEIATWGRFTPEERDHLMAVVLPARQAQVEGAAGS